jgi:UDP-N-acetylmuramoyl-L-alanyl-D-glutamate--2,6-diaminopimelate ligase
MTHALHWRVRHRSINGRPSTQLRLAGITGTNGKTTTTHLLGAIFAAAGLRASVLGPLSGTYTTPEAPDIQGFLRRAVDKGARFAMMEVSSHAIVQHRVLDLDFDVAAFTNLTQDHLDYHGTIEACFAAKRELFLGGLGRKPRRSVINADDPRGSELAGIGGDSTISYALDAPASVSTSAREFGLEGLRFTAKTPRGEIEIESTLVGRAHAYNILCGDRHRPGTRFRARRHRRRDCRVTVLPVVSNASVPERTI